MIGFCMVVLKRILASEIDDVRRKTTLSCIG